MMHKEKNGPKKFQVFLEGLNWISKFIIGNLFAYAGILKISDVKAFAKTLSLYNLVPEQLLPFVAISLPIIDIVAGVGLIFNIRFYRYPAGIKGWKEADYPVGKIDK